MAAKKKTVAVDLDGLAELRARLVERKQARAGSQRPSWRPTTSLIEKARARLVDDIDEAILEASHAVDDGQVGRTVTILLAAGRALRRKQRTVTDRLYNKATAALRLSGMADPPDNEWQAVRDIDAAAELRASQPGGTFTTYAEQEAAILAYVRRLLARPDGIGPRGLSHRLVRVIGVAPLKGATDKAAVKAVEIVIADAPGKKPGDGRVILDDDALIRLLKKAMRAVGIDSQRRPKPFAGLRKKSGGA